MDIERKIFDCGQFKASNEGEGIAEMIVSVFGNLDAGGDVVMPGFFADSLSKRRTADGRPRVKGVWSHDWTSPIAKTLDAKELLPGDPLLPPHLSALGGLWVKAQFNLNTQRGREAFSDLQFGTIDEFSIGYRTQTEQYDNETGVRKLIKGELYEWSPVLVGMNDQTALLSVKQFQGQTLTDARQTALAAVSDVTERYKALAAELSKEGRQISAQRRERMGSWVSEVRKHAKDHATTLNSLADDIEALLTETEPQKAVDLSGEYLRFMKISAGL